MTSIGSELRTLIDVAGIALGQPQARLPLGLIRRYGAPAAELAALLAQRNGFFAFERALHVFPLGPADGYDLTRWNSADLWRATYGRVTNDFLFFAEDLFGEQFCLYDERVWRFNPETGEFDQLGPSLEAWAQCILDDFVTETGYPMGRAWQTRHGALAVNERLMPIVPFVLGGQFRLENLRAIDAAESMRARAALAQHIHGLPEGSEVRFIIGNGED